MIFFCWDLNPLSMANTFKWIPSWHILESDDTYITDVLSSRSHLWYFCQFKGTGVILESLSMYLRTWSLLSLPLFMYFVLMYLTQIVSFVLFLNVANLGPFLVMWITVIIRFLGTVMETFVWSIFCECRWLVIRSIHYYRHPLWLQFCKEVHEVDDLPQRLGETNVFCFGCAYGKFCLKFWKPK